MRSIAVAIACRDAPQAQPAWLPPVQQRMRAMRPETSTAWTDQVGWIWGIPERERFTTSPSTLSTRRSFIRNVDDRDAWNEDLYGSINGGKTWVRVICRCEVGAQAIAFSSVVPDRLYLGDDGHRTLRYFVADGTSHPSIYPGGDIHGNDVRYIIAARQNGASNEACYSLTDQGLFVDADCASGPAVGLTNAVPNFLTT
jgi:hypothetical protein